MGRKHEEREPRLKPETKKSILAVALILVAIILTLAYFDAAGPVGRMIFRGLEVLFGWGYFVLPLALLLVGGTFLFSKEKNVLSVSSLGGALLIVSLLAIIELFSPGHGGWLGLVLGSLRIPFGTGAAVIINVFVSVIALLVTLDIPINLKWPVREKTEEEADEEPEEEEQEEEAPEEEEENNEEEEVDPEVEVKEGGLSRLIPKFGKTAVRHFTNYTPPPLSLLKSTVEKPTTGDLRANANIIKRTLDSFGIAVEMGEINVGPKVTRYTLKPAEGMKLSRIETLHKDLALALAAHPIRIEAPIPGKSLVGIEVPNKAAALVRLGSLLAYEDFQKGGLLSFALGRDVTGEPMFADLERMPHILVAGATGSGKSVTIHDLIISLLYKNSPETLKFVMVDPKRVELSIYDNIPHLVTPVITENKKAVGVFRWALKEMDRRYDLLLKAGCRDIKGYNASLANKKKEEGGPEPLPFLVIVIDEMADLMTTYGREVEGSIVRLAQMARATGIHLVLSTQRPSVEVITGLIKANITSRIALQVASQIDSRTILDTSGAEKLLGGGDLLFIAADLSKPKRIQGAFLSDEEVHAVADFIRENNPMEFSEVDLSAAPADQNSMVGLFDDTLLDGGDGDDDELYPEALEVVREAKKASASLLQRRLKVGYARAARLLDIMEEKGVIGPGDGAKPREVYLEGGEE